MLERPTIVCLVGSMRFREHFERAYALESLSGRIVLLPVFDWISTKNKEGVIAKLRQLHRSKIDLCDELLVLNVGGYIGPHTHTEIGYANEHGKFIRLWEPYADV